jgi:hypothetical protein
MGWFKDGIRVVNYIFTLGGSYEVEEAQKHYNVTYSSYKSIHEEITELKLKIDGLLNDIGQVITSSQVSLNKSDKLIRSSKNTLKSTHIIDNSTVTAISTFNQQYTSALSVGFGGVLGGTTAVGAWALVSIIGSASTGTAIAGLSGVAATNATLAWFGGGALAAGGAGMSGGMMVLGGIVAAPMIFFATKGAYAKAEKLKKEENKLANELKKYREIKPEIEQQHNYLKSYSKEINILCVNYITEIDSLLNIIYPLGWLSKGMQQFRVLFKLTPLSEVQVRALECIVEKTNGFLNAFTKVQSNK